MSSFNGKSVLVLGGSRGIGAAIVRRFAADGASVTFTYSGSPDAAKALADETGTQIAPIVTPSSTGYAKAARWTCW